MVLGDKQNSKIWETQKKNKWSLNVELLQSFKAGMEFWLCVDKNTAYLIVAITTITASSLAGLVILFLLTTSSLAQTPCLKHRVKCCTLALWIAVFIRSAAAVNALAFVLWVRISHLCWSVKPLMQFYSQLTVLSFQNLVAVHYE